MIFFKTTVCQAKTLKNDYSPKIRGRQMLVCLTFNYAPGNTLVSLQRIFMKKRLFKSLQFKLTYCIEKFVQLFCALKLVLHGHFKGDKNLYHKSRILLYQSDILRKPQRFGPSSNYNLTLLGKVKKEWKMCQIFLIHNRYIQF